MNKYVIEEQRNLYGVLLYSDNPILINELSISLKKENIFLKVKKINNNFIEKYESIDKHNSPVKVMVDLTGYRFEFEKIDDITNPHEDDIIFILNKSFKRNSRRSLGNKNNVIFVDKITKISATKISDFLISVLAGRNQKSIDLTKKRNIFFYKKYKYSILLLILFLVIFMPYILNIYLILNNYFFDKVILQKVSLIKAKEICSFDEVSKKFIKGIILSYTKIPHLSFIYQKSKTLASGSYEESVYACNLISYADKIKSTLGSSVFNEVVIAEGSTKDLTEKPPDVFYNFYLYPGFNETLYDYRKEVFQFFRLYDFINKNTYSSKKKYFLLLLQNNNVLTPTGGMVEEITVFSTDGGRLVVVEKIEPSKLNRLFKGRVGNVVFPDTSFINYDYDKSLTFRDKFKILKTIFSESSNINISGMVSIEQQALNGFIDARSLVMDKNISLLKSLENYKKILLLQKSGNINFVFEQGVGLIESREVLGEVEQRQGECNVSIKIIQEKENNSTNAVTEVKVVGKKENNLLRLALNVSDRAGSPNDLFLINISKGELINTVDGKTVSTYTLGKEEYLSLNIYKTNNNGNIEYINHLDACKNGFSVVFEKQPGNSSVQIYYDYATDSEYNLYLDGTLTNGGNKFYNTQSFNLLHDTEFYFVK